MPRVARRHGFFPVVSALLVLAASATAQTRSSWPDRAPAPDDATVSDARSWITTLASDDMAGRQTGDPGFMKAAEFMAARFREFGLEPGSNGKWFQEVPFIRQKLSAASKIVISTGNDARTELRFGSDAALPILRECDITAPLALLRGSLRDADLKGIDATGRILLVAAEPSGADGRRFRLSLASDIRRATRAEGVFFVDDAAATRELRASGLRYPGQTTTRRASAPVIPVTEAAMKRLVAALGPRAEAPAASGTESRPPSELIPLDGVTASIRVGVDEETVPVPNVVGRLPGSDPALQHECVIIGSHLDHVGVASDGDVFNGADDDASGSTALLVVARAFARAPHPRRTLYFAAFCGEEMGLLGSKWFADHLPVPVENVVAEFQMDMVGRNEESTNPRRPEKPEDNLNSLHLVGSKRLSKELHDIVLQANEHVKFDFEYDEEDVYSRSDHYNFAAKGIPIAFVFTGFHPDYHQVTDTADKIDCAKLVRVARLVHIAAADVADLPRRIVVDKGPLATRREDGGSEDASAESRAESRGTR